MRRIFSFAICVLLFIGILYLSGCECKHEWSEASCTLPASCTKCGEANGSPLGHTMSPADCENAATCLVCGLSEGEPAGHDFHDVKLINYTQAVEHHYSECSICGETSNKSKTSIKKLHNGSKFLFTPDQWYDRYDTILDSNSSLYASGPIEAEGVSIYGIYNSTYDGLGYARFYDEDVSDITDMDENSIAMIFIEFFTLDTDVIRASVCAILSADPTLSYDEGWAILANCFDDDGYTHNGISYFGEENGSSMKMGILVG